MRSEGTGDAFSFLPSFFLLIFTPHSYCYACDFCSNGLINHCERGGTRAGVGVFKDGGFAKYVVVPAELCFTLPDNVSFDQGGRGGGRGRGAGGGGAGRGRVVVGGGRAVGLGGVWWGARRDF